MNSLPKGVRKTGMPVRTAPKWVKPTAEYGPLAAFFLAYLIYGLMPATAVLLATTLVALVLSLSFERRIPWMPVITAALVGLFGGLTLWFNDETFIKMKPTVVQAMFSAVLLGGLVFGKPLLKMVIGAAWPMDDRGWRRLTFRYGVFFAAMAALNEVVWRTQSTDVWVTFKVFGLMALTLAFALAQAPLMSRHRLPDDAAPEQASGRE
jgi:intracellular septation protein